MRRLSSLLRVVAVLAVLAAPAYAQYQKAQSWCGTGGVIVAVPGTGGSTLAFQQSAPACTITVFDTGTASPSILYANSTGTAKANPFTAATSGLWFFYADPAKHYDVVMSGGGLVTPVTLSDVAVNGAAGSLPGSLGTAGQQITVNPTATGSVWQSKPSIDVRDKGAACDGTTDDIVPLQAAVDAVRTLGGQVIVPYNCRLKITTPLDVSLATPNWAYSTIIKGAYPVSTGHSDNTGQPAIICAMTSGTSCINAQSSQGFSIDGVNIMVNNNSFTGFLIDFAHNASGADASFMSIRNLAMGGTSTSNISAKGISLCNAIEGVIDRVNFRLLDVAIRGIDVTSCSYANAMTVSNSQFLWLGTDAIEGTSQAWNVWGNTFEGCQPGAAGVAYPCAVNNAYNDTNAGNANEDTLNYHGNWHEGGMGGLAAWLRLGGFSPSVHDNYFGGSSGSNAISDISRTTNLVTVTMSTAANFRIGASASIAGTGAASLNHRCVVHTRISTTQFTCWMPGIDVVAVGAGGTVNLKTTDIQLFTGMEGAAIYANTFVAGVGIAFYDSANGGGFVFNANVADNHTWTASGITLIDPQAASYGLKASGLVASSVSTLTTATNIIPSQASTGDYLCLGCKFPATSLSGAGVVTVGVDLAVEGPIFFPTDNADDIGSTSGSNQRPRRVYAATDFVGPIGQTTPAAGTFTSVTAATISGAAVSASASHAVCWKTTTTLGYCSDTVGAGGTCTCN